MKRTLLDLTQSILSSLNSDEVNSIGDTVESQQVAEIIKTTYFNIMSRSDIPTQCKLLQLTPSNDPTVPVIMYRPDSIKRIEWIKYFDDDITSTGTSTFQHDLNTDLVLIIQGQSGAAPNYKYVTILPITQFLDMTNSFNTNESNVSTYTFHQPPNSFTFNYKNNKQPSYCAVVGNYYVLFDSFDSNVDDTLQASKSLCYGETEPLFLMQDTFIPELDSQQFPLLLNEAKSLAFLELKQMIHPKADKESSRQWSALQKTKALFDKPTSFEQLADFGRRAGTGGYAVTR